MNVTRRVARHPERSAPLQRGLLIAALVALPSTLAAQGQAWVVGPAAGPGVDFTNLRDAIDAAADLDLIQVLAGTYAGGEELAIADKHLTLVGEPGAHVQNFFSFAPALEVTGLAATKSVTVRGIRFESWLQVGTPLVVEDCAGPVVFEDCEFEGLGQPLGNPNGPLSGVRIASSDNVTLHRCSVVAPPNRHNLANCLGSAAIDASDSDVYLFDSELVGGEGEDAFFLEQEPFFAQDVVACDGGVGVRMTGGSLTVQGTEVTSGDGGDGDVLCEPGDGGSGIEILGAASVRVLDSDVAGGVGGAPGPGCVGDGAAGSAYVGTGTLELLDGGARSFDWSRSVVGGELLTMSLSGEPGDFAFVLASFALGQDVYFPDLEGTLFLQSFVLLSFGTLPSGTLELEVDAPFLGGAVGFLPLMAQAGFIDALGVKFVATGPSILAILDES